MDRIPTPTISDFLREYMEPLNLSAYKLAKEIHVPVSRIQDLLHNRRKMTVDTSIRLGKFFVQDDLFFMRIQMDLDYRETLIAIEKDIETIKPINKLIIG